MLTVRTYSIRKIAYALSPGLIRLLRDYLRPRGRRLPLPGTLTLDVCNACNLACPICATGRGTLGRPARMLSREDLLAVLDQAPGLRHLNLFDWGEPLLNPELFAMVRVATDRGIRTNLHSNFSLALSDDTVESMVTSGLTDLVLSIDGIRQESYEAYRRGGNLALVLSNLDRLLAVRRRLRTRTPIVTWKLLETVHNSSEVPEIARLCRRLGIRFHRRPIDTRRTVDDVVAAAHVEPPSRWLTPRDQTAPPPNTVALRGRCYHLWFRPMIRPDLGVAPCCNVSRSEHDFGSLREAPLEKVWNNERFRYARSLFTSAPSPRPSGGVICERCDLVIDFRARASGECVPPEARVLSEPERLPAPP